MPTYQYQCKQCGNELEEFQSMTEPPLVRCPKCNTDNLARVLGAGGGLIFKGTGFYLTDYKKDSGKGEKPQPKKDEQKGEKKEQKGEATRDTKVPPKSPPSEKSM
jgi:putative FmdB family regulatory protein